MKIEAMTIAKYLRLKYKIGKPIEIDAGVNTSRKV